MENKETLKGSRHYLNIDDKEILLEALKTFEKHHPIGDLFKRKIDKLKNKIMNKE